ncbi:type II secretion system ATPase GspE [Brevundimonas variabilis]|uniref:Type II secretion system protein E n=1 Tax=Brevundimonas variabilis TaxID=74312 RepID=A0A7W9CKE4_9CAUL|nr:type II secretion system ATPase GspE [Brevundimonas variabilis]MBB5747181.1 general secretion pathway protein E [Brevundimonas variabilis]
MSLIEEAPPVLATGVLGYGFARRRGAMILRPANGQGGEAPVCLHRRSATLETLLEVRRVHGGDIAFEAVDDDRFDAILRDQTGGEAAPAADFAASDDDLAALAEDAAAVDDLLDSRDDAPVVRLINALLLQAIRDGASDIHIEAEEKRLVVRFRIDGVLREVLEPARALAPLLVSRIKVMARLDIAEKRVPHDGRVTLRIGGLDVDVRVSTIPSQHGERVVLRLLDRGSTSLDLAQLGMSARDLETFERLIARPHGIILVTGPTGSGKTTTLYSVLTRLNDRRRNIMTVEDPIEYALDGIGQMQVNARIDLTFARGLRAILRQDPDVIMVGEIRDHETAEVAVRASMTGHLMLSTLHTNTAVGSVTRLIDMGVERYLLAPMLTGLAAQRLVRRLCPSCKAEGAATDFESEMTGGAVPVGARIWRPVGCADCRGEGYRGRTGVYEVIEIDQALQKAIHDGMSEGDLVRLARSRGPGLLEDGALKAMMGETSVQEVARVVREDS